MRIYLTGFMGSGKTHIGKQLAAQLGFAFQDLDDLIEERAGMAISQIFLENGEAHFRDLEREALHATANLDETVISTGGGTPCYFDNMDWMNAHGLSIFLDAPPHVLARRLLPERAHRPLISHYDETSLPVFIRGKLEERMYFYRKAAIIYLQEADGDPIVAELIKLINGKRKTRP